MRVLVCGSRTWADRLAVPAVLTGLYVENTVGHLTVEMSEFVVIEGGAAGADSEAARWSGTSPMHSHNESPEHPRFEHLWFKADWQMHGKKAGYLRNKQMLEEGKPDVVWAFVDKPLEESKGTFNMVTLAREASIPEIYVVQKV